jgi:hypothetical protein
LNPFINFGPAVPCVPCWSQFCRRSFGNVPLCSNSTLFKCSTLLKFFHVSMQQIHIGLQFHRVESRFLLSHSQLKSPTISTHFQRSLKELENSISGVRRRRQKVDGYSNEKRRRGSITHPLKSAIQRSRALGARSAANQRRRRVLKMA